MNFQLCSSGQKSVLYSFLLLDWMKLYFNYRMGWFSDPFLFAMPVSYYALDTLTTIVTAATYSYL